LVYSGDTRPSKKLAEAAKDATLLIHEATFEDDLQEEALAKKHSTSSEAIQTGIDAQAYRTILTHFSQRYPKIPIPDDSYTGRTGIAFDLMTVNFADLPVIPSLVSPLRLVFEDICAATDTAEAADTIEMRDVTVQSDSPGNGQTI